MLFLHLKYSLQELFSISLIKIPQTFLLIQLDHQKNSVVQPYYFEPYAERVSLELILGGFQVFLRGSRRSSFMRYIMAITVEIVFKSLQKRSICLFQYQNQENSMFSPHQIIMESLFILNTKKHKAKSGHNQINDLCSYRLYMCVLFLSLPNLY